MLYEVITRHQAYDGPGQGGLAATGLPHHPQGLPFIELDADPVQRLQGDGFGPGPALLALDLSYNLV